MDDDNAVASTSGINDQKCKQPTVKLIKTPTKDLCPEQECKQIKSVKSKSKKPLNMSPGAVKLRSWLNKPLKIEMSDGRVLIGIFLCTDRDANVILGSCSEYLPEEEETSGNECSQSQDEPRMLGLVMVPGKHIVSVCIDQSENYTSDLSTPLTQDVPAEDVM